MDAASSARRESGESCLDIDESPRSWRRSESGTLLARGRDGIDRPAMKRLAVRRALQQGHASWVRGYRCDWRSKYDMPPNAFLKSSIACGASCAALPVAAYVCAAGCTSATATSSQTADPAHLLAISGRRTVEPLRRRRPGQGSSRFSLTDELRRRKVGPTDWRVTASGSSRRRFDPSRRLLERRSSSSPRREFVCHATRGHQHGRRPRFKMCIDQTAKTHHIHHELGTILFACYATRRRQSSATRERRVPRGDRDTSHCQ